MSMSESIAAKRAAAKAKQNKESRTVSDSPNNEGVRTEPYQAMSNVTALQIPDPKSFLMMVDQIVVRKQSRDDFDTPEVQAYLKELAEDIKENGQYDPVIVSRDPTTNEIVLDDGECRLRAIRDFLKDDSIRVTYYSDDEDPFRRRIRQLNANEKRRNFSRIQVAKGYKMLMEDAGWNQKELAEHVGLTKATVSKYFSLLDAPEPIQRDINSGDLAARDYWNNKQMVLDAYEKNSGLTLQPTFNDGKESGDNTTEIPTAAAVVKSTKKSEKTASVSLPEDILLKFLRKLGKSYDVGTLSVTKLKGKKKLEAIQEYMKEIESAL